MRHRREELQRRAGRRPDRMLLASGSGAQFVRRYAPYSTGSKRPRPLVLAARAGDRIEGAAEHIYMATKDNPRAQRLGEQIQRELTELLRRNVKDERIGNETITAVRVTGGLRTAL